MSDMTERDEITLQLVAERLRGLRDVTEQGFTDIQRQLDDVKGLPTVVAAMRERQESHEKRIQAIESSGSRGVEFRRGSLPIIALTLVLALSSVISVITQVH